MSKMNFKSDFNLTPLRRAAEEQLLELLTVRNEPSVRNNMTNSKVIDYCSHFRWFKVMSERKDIDYNIVSDESRIIGAVALTDISTLNKSANFAIYLSSTARGKGFGEKLCKIMLDRGFSHHGLDKVNLQVASHNIRAIQLYKKMGWSTVTPSEPLKVIKKDLIFMQNFRQHLMIL